MFFNLAWRNSKRNRSENLIYFLTMVTAVATFYIVLYGIFCSRCFLRVSAVQSEFAQCSITYTLIWQNCNSLILCCSLWRLSLFVCLHCTVWLLRGQQTVKSAN